MVSVPEETIKEDRILELVSIKRCSCPPLGILETSTLILADVHHRSAVKSLFYQSESSLKSVPEF